MRHSLIQPAEAAFVHTNQPLRVVLQRVHLPLGTVHSLSDWPPSATEITPEGQEYGSSPFECDLQCLLNQEALPSSMLNTGSLQRHPLELSKPVQVGSFCS